MGHVTRAFLDDGVGRRRTFLLFAVGSPVGLTYRQIAMSNGLMQVLGFSGSVILAALLLPVTRGREFQGLAGQQGAE